MVDDLPVSITLKSWLYYPVFSNDWIRKPLYSLAKWVNGLAFREIQFSETGMPVIKIAEIKGGISGQTRFTQQIFDESVHVKPDDLLFSWSGQPETSIDVFWWRGPEGWLNQHSFKVTPAEYIDSTFFYYLLRYLKPNFIGIARNKQTTGLGHVTKQDLENIEVAYPPISEQRAIARILGTLDDKIELNRQINQTLEAMTQALFKSWFVDFEPFRDQGMQDSPLGEIPTEWSVEKIGQVLELKYGKGLKEEYRTAGDVPVYGSNGLVGWHNESLSKGPGIVVGRKGNPGTVTWAPVDFFPIDTTFYVEPIAAVKSMFYLFYALRLLDLPSLGADSAVPGLNRNMAYMSDILVPPETILIEFDKYVSPLMDMIFTNDKESQTLSNIRDALLPKLLSGEIQVKNAEKFVEKAA